MLDTNAKILDHYAKQLNAEPVVLAEDATLTIAAYAPTRNAQLDEKSQVVITAGMSSERMKNGARAELVWAIPHTFATSYGKDLKDSWIVDTTRTLARYPFERGTHLGAGHTLPVGRALAPQTQMAGVVLTMPLVFAKPLASFSRAKDDVVSMLLATPLYPAELALAQSKGTDALLDRLFSLVETFGQDWSFFTLPKRPDTVAGGVLMA